MRHNQNSRRPQRGRSGGGGGGYNSGGGNHTHNAAQQGGRRVNPRIQNFDSNGPDVRIRGTAYQINEKYVTLARDAASAGDRVLAESYLQHAEHYQRFINEMTEEMNQYNQQNPQHQPQPHVQQPAQPQPDGNMAAPEAGTLNDLDQSFLVGPRHGAQPNGPDTSPTASGTQDQPQGDQQPRQHRSRHSQQSRRGEPEAG
ncbi:MAG: DUF4167 domain-containing protein [Alphaproteobacteria bacterium]|nr:DUF4167 domain-containing protein [Alphaproteobacteria bacterium]